MCRRYGVKELSLFGSAVHGKMGPDSDIDIMVEFEPGVRVGLIKFESLVDELAALAGRRVDLVTKRGLKRGTHEVLKDYRVIYAHEPSFLKDILSACRKIEAIVAATTKVHFSRRGLASRRTASSDCELI